MSIKRCIRRSDETESMSDRKIGDATARILDLLRNGEYLDGMGRRCKVRGDVRQIIGLTPMEKMLLRNYQFMSSRIAGTRQVRRNINHLLFSARVIYGTPTFITVTPSEKHSGLCVHLFRYRRNDPAMVHAGTAFRQYIGADYPSIYFSDKNDCESAFVDLPEYDVRRAMIGRDPLCALHAFWVSCIAIAVWVPNVSRLPQLHFIGKALHGCIWKQCNSYGWKCWSSRCCNLCC